MKKIYITIILLLFIKINNAQEFIFPLYFEDAAGNKDTLILGYDINASDSIDSFWSEVNIISLPLNNIFDVRVTNENLKRNWGLTGTFHTKKQIIQNSCNYQYSTFPIISIDIKCNHWPVTAKWDSTLFADKCRNQSLFASFPFWENWDVFRPNDIYTPLMQQKQITFDKCEYNGYSPTAYENNSNDTIYVYYVGLDEKQISVGISKNNLLKDKWDIRRENNHLLINTEQQNIQIENIQIIDLTGKIIRQDRTNNIDISNLTQGLYFCRIQSNNKKIETFKFIK